MFHHHGIAQDSNLLKLFLDARADPNTCSRRHRHSMSTDGRSTKFLLHQVVEMSRVDVARMLLDAGATVDAVSSAKFYNAHGYNTNMADLSAHLLCVCGWSAGRGCSEEHFTCAQLMRLGGEGQVSSRSAHTIV